MEERAILGENYIYSTDPEETGLNNNRLIIGGTGSGKTMSLLEPELLEGLRSGKTNRIVICTKRRLIEKYMYAYQKAGCKVYDLNFTNPDRSNCTFDPLYYVNSDRDVMELARSVVMANEKKETANADPFWDDSAISLLAAEIALAQQIVEKATFADVLDLHDQLVISDDGSGIVTSLDALYEQLNENMPENIACSCYKTFREAAPKTAKSIYVSMNAVLSVFTPELRQTMKQKPAIDFDKFTREKSIIFVTTSPVNKAYHCVANMFVATALAQLFQIAEQNNGELPIPVHIDFDDFATGARIADFPEKISICRSQNISFSLLLQSEAQLERMYSTYGCTEIEDNCDSFIFLGSNNTVLSVRRKS